MRDFEPAHALGVEDHAADDLDALGGVDVGDEGGAGGGGFFFAEEVGGEGGGGGGVDGGVEGGEVVFVAFPEVGCGVVGHSFDGWGGMLVYFGD